MFPPDWKDRFTLLAGTFHFQPKSLWNMDAEELDFWFERAEQWGEWNKVDG